jgi:hypothetical protein
VNRSLNAVHAPTSGDVHEWVDRRQVSLRDTEYWSAVERVTRMRHERGWV